MDTIYIGAKLRSSIQYNHKFSVAEFCARLVRHYEFILENSDNDKYVAAISSRIARILPDDLLQNQRTLTSRINWHGSGRLTQQCKVESRAHTINEGANDSIHEHQSGREIQQQYTHMW